MATLTAERKIELLDQLLEEANQEYAELVSSDDANTLLATLFLESVLETVEIVLEGTEINDN